MGRDPAQFLVRVSSDGTVLWPFSRTIESSCKLNVADFPFDRQECYFRFGSWAFTADELDIINAHDSGDVGSYVDNGEWNLLGMRVERDFATYRCCPGSYPFVTFTLVLERRYLYYVYNLISPCMIITLLGLTSFFLPAESGEKISLNVTILLGLTVFLLLVAEIMPPQSEVIPVIGMGIVFLVTSWKFLGLCIFVTSLSTTMSVVVLNLYFCGAREKSVPPWVRKWILGKLGYLLCARKVPQGCEQFHETPKAELIFVRGPENNLVSDRTPSPPTLSQRQRKLPVDDLGLHHEVLPDKKQEGTDLIKDWRLVSLIVDRLFFICISLADFAAFFYIVLPLLVRRPP
ncbi:neuronal acetylcholine receptor subunit alpha-10-like [Liolophura sinensis]|uniref:neuronal acetylcholine receptor subunit alpha-10-like n=1 Tax=Liolophura sinensis TaxID=3198878 RepID=UPI00315937B7